MIPFESVCVIDEEWRALPGPRAVGHFSGADKMGETVSIDREDSDVGRDGH